jgi:hypothetical protein
VPLQVAVLFEDSEAELSTMVDYSSEWDAYRLRRNAAIIGFVCFLPLFTLLIGIFGHFLWAGFVVGVLGLAWLLGIFVAGVSVLMFRCPRCNKRFGATWWYNKSVFVRKCVHCGLPKFGNG